MRKSQISEKQLAASRANAARSTGPRTPEGKARSSQNARKHGFTGSTFSVVRLEDLQEIANLRADLVACYQPVNSQELFALETHGHRPTDHPPHRAFGSRPLHHHARLCHRLSLQSH